MKNEENRYVKRFFDDFVKIWPFYLHLVRASLPCLDPFHAITARGVRETSDNFPNCSASTLAQVLDR